MREHVEDANAMIERWVEVFDMQMTEDGAWRWDGDQTILDTHLCPSVPEHQLAP
jgi:hypothetical protein